MPMGFNLEIVTPDRLVIIDEVEKVVCPGAEGEFGVLPNHVPLITKMKIGEVRYIDSTMKNEHIIVVTGGYVEVTDKKVIVLAEQCIRARDIDKVQEEINVQKAEEILKTAEKTTEEYLNAKKTYDLAKAQLKVLEKTG
jgi:F-type H+-transporting ATPase subunit epsilon